MSVPVQGSATSLESIESASQERSRWKVQKEVQEGSKLLSLQLLWKLLGRIDFKFVYNFYDIFLKELKVRDYSFFPLVRWFCP